MGSHHDDDLSRREFLQTSALAGALLAGPMGRSAAVPAAAAPAAEGWFDRPLRWANLTMVQDDPGKFDLQFWLDYIRRCRCDAASWNAGGIVAFYPTAIPFHRRNAALGGSDPFGALVEGSRKLGIIVTARVDHHATYDEAAAAHPEWIAVDARGNKRRHWAAPELWVTCGLGPYNEHFMTSVLREIAAKYGVDGFNHNRWAGSGLCYCDHCRTSFEASSGDALPRTDDPLDPVRRRYDRWRERRLWELWDLWDAAVRAINPRAAILPGIPNDLMRQADLSQLRRRAHTLYHDHQGRSGLDPPWSAGRGGKQLRAVLGPKPVGLTFSVGREEGRYRWKDSVQSEAETRIWAAGGVANGMSLKFAKFAGTLHDRRWLPVVERLYNRLAEVEPYLRNVSSMARVALVYSQQTERFYRTGDDRRDPRDHATGMYHALVEARLPFEMVHEALMGPDDVDRYALLVLPNVAALSDDQCEQLRSYVRRGGSLLATFETSMYDEAGRRRDDFGLADLFGVGRAGPIQGPMKNAYLRIEAGTGHPVLKGLEDAGRIIHGAYRLPVRARAAFPDPPLTLIPPYPDLPMEEVYPREDHTGIPEIYLRRVGPGRVAYVPWDLDRIFWDVLDADHGRLLANLVAWAADEPPTATAEGPGLLEVTAWRQASSLTVHLVNLTNPMMLKGPFRELIPLTGQTVRLRLPEGARPKAVRLLFAKQEPRYDLDDGVLSVDVPTILDHEIVAVDLA